MVLESLGVIKAATALKGAAIGLAGAVPPLINNSAAATQQLVTIATPVVTQGIALAGAGLAALGVAIAKGTAALKTSLAAAGGAKAATGAAAATTAATGTTAATLVSALTPPIV